ncbi:signal recognition particle-docking protein FtsY [Oryzicola mucosus]|uniref:Signal recognition particle receptor FtsY n=1 Tax=Oryzicola mucosus TaxID=2767425 RepID=A0A8J6PUE5_9HYPH|nr:signal recognition particle-docking protein FtsY [Oryzicola mucosus]MBD0413972.1 signal recognition particle-docking protein FtsY [Oryzicola mucosus]
MAFNFIKKVFSFGKKDAEDQPVEAVADVALLEARPPEADVPAPGADVPDFLKRETPEAAEPEQPKPEETPVAPPEPAVTPESVPDEAPAPPPAEQPLPVDPEQPKPAPVEMPPETPQPETPAETPPAPPAEVPTPAPAEVPAEDPQEAPVPAPSPAEPEPAPVEVPAPVEPATPVEVPQQPVAEAVPQVLAELRAEAEAKLEEAELDPVVVENRDETVSPPHPAASQPPSPRWGEEEAGIAANFVKADEGQTARPQPKPAAGKVTVQKKVEQKGEIAPVAPPAAPRQTWFQRLREGLSRSSRELSGNIAGIFTKRKLDEETLQDLEDVLIRADLGVETALRITDTLAASRYGKDVSDLEVRTVMAEQIEKVLGPVAIPLELDLSHKPHVILVVGVNGTGKTTTIGKLAAKLTSGGLSVMLAAGDTFRAAAIEQLKIWGERTNSPVIATKLGADAAGLAFDAFQKAKEAGSDVLIIDTAGRLQNKAELMAELEKVVRVLGKLDPEAPHTVLQTVDATTGQNALNQVEIFRNIAGVNGLVMTKLDGTARGGILVAIAAKHRLPVYFIGVGEQIDDLEPFSASDFAKAIAGVA